MNKKIMIVWAVVGVAMSGCTIKATTDTTTDGTTEFVSSTTGKTWWTEEGLVKQGHHAEAFVFVNYENLLEDIAKGEGEYLESLAHILGIPREEKTRYFQEMQRNFSNTPIVFQD